MQDVDSESRSRRIAPADEGEATGLAAQIVLWLGAALSVALVAGVVFWAYNLGQREANDVPVIRALEGLPRERPEDPGGTQVAHQGMAVNEVLAGSESADTVQSAELAPEGSGLTSDDQPSLPDIEAEGSVTPEAESGEVVPGGAGTFAPQTAEIEPAADTSTDPAADAPENLTALDIPRPIRRASAAPANGDDSALSAAIAEALELAENGGVVVSTSGGPDEPITPPDTPGDTREVLLGTRMIQLGAFDSEAAAVEQWTQLSAAHPQFFANMDRYVERRQAGGRVFYRLRALGFDDLEAARAMCAALLAREVQCITVTARE